MSPPRRAVAVGLILATTAVAYLVLWSVADGLFYHPNDTVYGSPRDYRVAVETVSFSAPGGPQLHGWWLPAEDEHRGTVVYCHGNAANVTLHARHVAWLPKLGFAVLVFDYRGYGRSQGSVTRAGTVADAIAAVDFALLRDPARTVLFGHSLGGAIAICAAAERPAVRAVIAESTFPSYRRVAAASAPLLAALVPLFVSDGEDPVQVVQQIAPRPLLVIHGTDDHIVPVALGRELFEAASEPKQLWVVEGARHATPWQLVPDAFEQRVDAFLRDAIAPR